MPVRRIGFIALFVLAASITAAIGLWLVDGEPVREGEPAAPDPFKAFRMLEFNEVLLTAPPVSQSFKPALRLEPPHDATGSTRLAHEDGEIAFAFVEGLERNAVCLDESEHRFPCGLMGRASLHNFLGNAEVMCQPVQTVDGEVRYRCHAGGTDLAAYQTAAGFARGKSLRPRLYAEELLSAKQENKGAWQGGWTIAQPAGAPTLPDQ